jgi:hypothetical protein
MALSYWLRAEVEDLLNEDTFFDISDYSWICLMENNYWKTAEIMNGRLAMMGLFAAVVNYGFTGWIIPGIV